MELIHCPITQPADFAAFGKGEALIKGSPYSEAERQDSFLNTQVVIYGYYFLKEMPYSIGDKSWWREHLHAYLWSKTTFKLYFYRFY